MAQGKDYHKLQADLGYNFKKTEYLLCALSHSSFANEEKNKGANVESNERLEFLGDAILQTVISEYLFKNFNKRREGSLTKMRQQLVCEKTLAKIATELKLGDYISIGHGEELTDCRRRPKVLADCLEAIIAAIYLDFGCGTNEEFSKVVLMHFIDKISEIANSQASDYKTMLQQFAEQDGSAVLKYETQQSGELHDPKFFTVAYINNNAVGSGVAKTKKESEMAAAKKALELFGIVE